MSDPVFEFCDIPRHVTAVVCDNSYLPFTYLYHHYTPEFDPVNIKVHEYVHNDLATVVVFLSN